MCMAHCMANRRGKGGCSDRFPLLGLQNHCGWWLQPWNQKAFASWQESYDKPREYVEKQRHYSANKGLYNEGYGLTNGCVQLWELNRKECRAPKNWCLRIMVLEKTPSSPLDCKEIKSINLKGNQPWILIGRTVAEAEIPVFWLWYEQLTHWKSPWCWERLRAEEEGIRGWQHQCNGHELGQTLGDGEGQRGLTCCSPWGCKESDMTVVCQASLSMGSYR